MCGLKNVFFSLFGQQKEDMFALVQKTHQLLTQLDDSSNGSTPTVLPTLNEQLRAA
jgi:hypothetical protein